MVNPRYQIGSKWEVNPYLNTTWILCVVTYAGKYGITVTSSEGVNYSIRTVGGVESKYARFHSFTVNPATNQPYTLAEYQHDYPEYFI